MCFHVLTRITRARRNAEGEIVGTVTERVRVGAFDFPDLPATFTVGQTEPQSLMWGLIPHWARHLEHAQELQVLGRNARAETMFEKPMFRDAARTGRCLIWLDGFFEWQHRGRKKVQYFIHMPGNELFPVGGLRSTWKNPQSGEVIETCAIVTTAANELMAEIHNTRQRMPFIVPPQFQADWLNPSLEAAALAEFVLPLPDGILIAEEVAAEKPEPPTGDALSLF